MVGDEEVQVRMLIGARAVSQKTRDDQDLQLAPAGLRAATWAITS